MQRSTRILALILFIFGVIGTIGILILLSYLTIEMILKKSYVWIIFGALFFGMINEGIVWIKNSKRSEWGDLLIIGFLFISVYLFTEDILNSFVGAFSIYLLLGIFELKDYEVLNKILLITVITYNFIFFAGLIGSILEKPVIRDTAFSLSFWVMLFLGFAFFGRKYIVVWRFMSPQYLTLALYLIAWLAVVSISRFTPYNIMDNIYEVLIIANIIIYIFTGPILDKMLGMKPTNDKQLLEIVKEVALRLNMNPNKVKVRFGQYPILNAMAYGAWFDMRIGVIAPDLNQIPADELKGIIAHELAHSKGKHTLTLTLISTLELVIRKLLGWPATYYDYVFAPDDQPFSMFWFIVINFAIYFFIYIFVRMLEAQADLQTRRIGYGIALAKGLYNLESFYSYGREIGLNTMLLCDEKITEENRLMDYMTTAVYLNKMIIKPTKGALISNFLNSHPPSYHRIMAVLHENEIGIAREALMPITFLRQRNARKFFLETQKAREQFRSIATTKIKEVFQIENIAKLSVRLNKNENHDEELGKTYVFRNYMNYQKFIAKLQTISYIEDVCEPIRYIVEYMDPKPTNFQEITELNPLLYTKVLFNMNSVYRLPKNKKLYRLKGIDLEQFGTDEKKPKKKDINDPEWLADHQGVFLFQEWNGAKASSIQNSTISKAIFHEKYPHSIDILQNFINNPVFVHSQGIYTIRKLELLEIKDSGSTIQIKLSDDSIRRSLADFIIQYGPIVIPLHNDENSHKSEFRILEFLQWHEIPVTIFLKKAVNNEEQAKIMRIEGDYNTLQLNKVHIRTIFDQDKCLDIQKMDFLLIRKPTLVFEPKAEMSFFSRIMDKIRAKYDPQHIIY